MKFWDEYAAESDWSGDEYFETGLMGDGWSAKWIGYDETAGEPYDPTAPFYCADDFEAGENTYYLPPVPYLRREFEADGDVERAKLYISAFGLVEAEVNGVKAGDDRFSPGLSDYDRTVYSRAYDVTGALRPGRNAVGVMLADGWYTGYMGLTSREWYGSKPRVMLQIEIIYKDGSTRRVVSDEHWRASYGALLESDIFQGETYDATKEHEGWSLPGFDDGDWAPVDTGAEKDLLPTAHIGVPVVEHGRVTPVHIIQKDEDTAIFDFGECLAGVVSLRLKGPRSLRVVIDHAELMENGELYLRGNRSARCRDTYILKGAGEERFQPRFTYHGFRYAKISGLKDVEIIGIEAVKLGSLLPEPTSFECSSDVVNDILAMIRNTQRSNQMEIPTDCCARDERLGWGMEGNHFLYSMSYLNNNERFVRKWAKDIWGAQKEDGSLEPIAPPLTMKDVVPFSGDLQTNHGLFMVYILYKIYGDKAIILEYYDKLLKYFTFLEQNSDRHIRFATSGDWLGIWEQTGHSDFLHGYGDCSPGMIGTAHYALAVGMMRELSAAIGRNEEADRFARLYEEIGDAFSHSFIQRDGSLRNGRQGDYLMALCCNFFPERFREKGMDRFHKMLAADGNVRWKGGTPTTPYFLRTLKKYGLTDLANRFLTSEEYPGLGYMLRQGATSVWERWDAIFEDGSLHPHPMNAVNHIGLTTVGDYLISGLAGIDALEAGFKKIRIEPGPSAEVTSAKARYHSCYGAVETRWRYHGGTLSLSCTIPANSTARIIVPARTKDCLRFTLGEPLSVEWDNRRAVAEVGSGRYALQTECDL